MKMRNSANILRELIQKKDLEYERKIEELQKGIVKLDKKIELVKNANKASENAD